MAEKWKEIPEEMFDKRVTQKNVHEIKTVLSMGPNSSVKRVHTFVSVYDAPDLAKTRLVDDMEDKFFIET